MMSRNKMKNLKFGALLVMSVGASHAHGEKVRCNDRQSECFIYDKSLALGDSVGVFTRDNELVAIGKVEKIDGGERKIDIDKRYGTIQRSHRLALLESDSMSDITKSFSIYKQPSKITAGASFSLSKMGVGLGASGMEVDAFGSYAWRRNFELVARGSFLSVSGQVNGDIFAPFPEAQFSMMGFGLAPGVAYHHNKNRIWSARAEANLGMMYSIAEVEQDDSILKNYVTDLEPGFGLLSRIEAMAFYRIGDWQPGAGASYLRVQGIQGFNLSFALSRDIK
jgi:hypothetical protein